MAAFAIPLALAALLAAAEPAPDADGELLVRVQPWHEQLEGTPVFIEGTAGTRLTPLDRHGEARIRLAPGDYTITLPRSASKVLCRWSAECGPVHVTRGAVFLAVMHVYKPSAVSSSEARIPER